MRILIIEDYEPLRRSLSKGLREAGHTIEATGDGEEGLWFLGELEFDVLVLDLMLPGIDGLSILRQVREKGLSTRVLILTAKDTVEDKVRGLNTGADDYLVKPFAYEELLARINVLARRRHGLDKAIVRLEGLEIDTLARTVSSKGRRLELTPKEYALLELMIMRRGHVLSRDQIRDYLYDFETENSSNVIEVFVRRLRQKLEADGSPRLIQTRRGFGYIIEAHP